MRRRDKALLSPPSLPQTSLLQDLQSYSTSTCLHAHTHTHAHAHAHAHTHTHLDAHAHASQLSTRTNTATTPALVPHVFLFLSFSIGLGLGLVCFEHRSPLPTHATRMCVWFIPRHRAPITSSGRHGDKPSVIVSCCFGGGQKHWPGAGALVVMLSSLRRVTVFISNVPPMTKSPSPSLLTPPGEHHRYVTMETPGGPGYVRLRQATSGYVRLWTPWL